MSYNGYSNYETWCLCLWIDNDQVLLYQAARIVGSLRIEDGSAAQGLKEYIEEIMPDLGATLWADLLTCAIGEINWQEAAIYFGSDDDE